MQKNIKKVLNTLAIILIISALLVGVRATSSIVGTTRQNGFNLDTQRCSFYANGRDWVFWDNGANYVFSSSTDGVSWAAVTVLGSVNHWYGYSAIYNGTYVAYIREGSSSNAYFRMGTPNNDGTITWLTGEQTISAATLIDVSIGFDTNGLIYITYSINGNDFLVSRTSTTNGIWKTAPGYPVTLDKTPTLYPYGTVTQLSNGHMGIIWCVQGTAQSSQALYYSIYNGASWSAKASFTTNHPRLIGNYLLIPFSVASSGNNIFVDFIDSSGNLRFNNFVYGKGWGTETTVLSSLSAPTFPSIAVDGSNLYIFYDGNPAANTIYYVKYNGVSWGSSQTLLTESSETLYPEEKGVSGIYSMISSFQTSANNQIGLIYLTRNSSPYNVKFSTLSTSSSPTPTPFPTSKPMTTEMNVNSNCTITNMQFDATNHSFYATVTTSGTLQITLNKNTLPDIASLNVYINSTQKTYTSVSLGNSWLVTIIA